MVISCPQSATLNAANLVFVGNASFVNAYLVITAESNSESFTMCLWMGFFGGTCNSCSCPYIPVLYDGMVPMIL